MPIYAYVHVYVYAKRLQNYSVITLISWFIVINQD